MHKNYLNSTYYFDYKSPEIQTLVQDFYSLTEQGKIKQLYLKVRDGWRYNPYNIGLTNDHFKASTIYNKTTAHCIDKSVLYVAGLRALGIPSRIRLAKVSNHIAIERLVEKLGTSDIAPHGMAEVYHNKKWVKCSPAFNKELCQKFDVDVLEFDGTKDSIFQEFNKQSKKFMSYKEDYGSFEDVPIKFIKDTFEKNYPKLYQRYKNQSEIQL